MICHHDSRAYDEMRSAVGPKSGGLRQNNNLSCRINDDSLLPRTHSITTNFLTHHTIRTVIHSRNQITCSCVPARRHTTGSPYAQLVQPAQLMRARAK